MKENTREKDQLKIQKENAEERPAVQEIQFISLFFEYFKLACLLVRQY